MPMKLEGSCQCGTVTFSLESSSPVPFMFCACSICRKLGTYGYACQLGGIADSLKVHSGGDKIKTYRAIKDRGTKREERCHSERKFCGECGSMLWLWDRAWPELVHPFSSAIDTDLPAPPEGEMRACMGNSKPKWVSWPEGMGKVFKEYPDESLEAWHKRTGMWVE